MKRGSTLFLKIIILLIVASVLTGLLWFPQTEGRATNLDLISIYQDPFIIYIYLASVPFFWALFQGFKLLGLVEKNLIFSLQAVSYVRNIKYSSFIIMGLVIGALGYIRFLANGDDVAGPTMLGLIAISICLVTATGATVFQKILQNAVEMKSENDLTV